MGEVVTGTDPSDEAGQLHERKPHQQVDRKCPGDCRSVAPRSRTSPLLKVTGTANAKSAVTRKATSRGSRSTAMPMVISHVAAAPTAPSDCS